MATSSVAALVPLPDVSTFGKRLTYIRFRVGNLSRDQFLAEINIDASGGSLRNWEQDERCTRKDELAEAIERRWPEFPFDWILRGHGEFATPPPAGQKSPASTQRNRRRQHTDPEVAPARLPAIAA